MSGDYTKNTQGLSCYASTNVYIATYNIVNINNSRTCVINGFK